jgi:hypothetical protein
MRGRSHQLNAKPGRSETSWLARLAAEGQMERFADRPTFHREPPTLNFPRWAWEHRRARTNRARLDVRRAGSQEEMTSRASCSAAASGWVSQRLW